MKKIVTALAGTAAVAGLTVAAPAQATGTTDLAVTSVKTGGLLGVYGNGAGTVANQGTTTIPAGTKLKIVVGDMPGVPDEIHANNVAFSDAGFASIRPGDIATQSWNVVTKKELKPGEVQKFRYTVLHYAPWHRVKHTIKVVSLGGLTDGNTANDVAAGLNL